MFHTLSICLVTKKSVWAEGDQVACVTCIPQSIIYQAIYIPFLCLNNGAWEGKKTKP